MKTGLPHPMFNIVIGARFPAAEVDARVKATLAQFQPEGIPFSWWIGPLSQPADLDQKLEAHGLGHDFAAPMQHFVAYLEDRPVACATVFLGGGVAGI
jgi:hypothetical protein